MDQNTLYENQKIDAELAYKLMDGKISWLQHIMLVCSAVLGLLAGLHSLSSGCTYVKYAFVATIILLAIATLTAGVALYGNQVAFRIDIRTKFRKELEVAKKQQREMNIITTRPKKIYKCFERICYVCLVLAIISLVTYSLLLAF